MFGEELRGNCAGRIGDLPEERGPYRRRAVRPLLEFHGKLRGGRNGTPEVNAWLERLDVADCANRNVEARGRQQGQDAQGPGSVSWAFQG